MNRSKLTTKARTAIPRRVRAAPDLKAGCAGRAGDPFRAFHEWRSEADAKAYGKL